MKNKIKIIEKVEDIAISTVLAEYFGLACYEANGQTFLCDESAIMPTDEEIIKARNIVFENKKSQVYKLQRKLEFDKLQDQLDNLYKDIDNGLLGETAKTGLFYQSISAVKNKYPKVTNE